VKFFHFFIHFTTMPLVSEFFTLFATQLRKIMRVSFSSLRAKENQVSQKNHWKIKMTTLQPSIIEKSNNWPK